MNNHKTTIYDTELCGHTTVSDCTSPSLSRGYEPFQYKIISNNFTYGYDSTISVFPVQSGGVDMEKGYIFEELLALWYSKSKAAARDTLLEDRQKLINKDKSLKSLEKLEKEFASKLEKLNSEFFEERGFNLLNNIPEDYISVSVDDLFEDEFGKLYSKYDELIESLRSIREEVECQLRTCDTREQGLKVLESYDIIDSSEKIKIKIK